MTDPTITIAGLEARINSLLSAVQHSNRTAAERVTMFVEASSNADRLTAERDALAAQLAEVRAELAAAPKVCAIHSYALEGPCMTCGAPWPGAEKALRQERIEGMEKMLRISRAVGCPNSVEEVVEAVAAIKADLASERETAASLRSEIAATCAEWNTARQSLASERAHLATCRTRIAGLEQAADERSAEVARLTARVAELEAAGRAIKITPTLLAAALVGSRDGSVTPAAAAQAERLLSLAGELFIAPPTSPPAAIDADALYARCERDFMGGYSGPLYDAFKHGMWTVCNVLRSTKPTSPPAARPVFAGVSEEELALEYARAVDRIPGIRAVLARLEVSLVAPVDPEAVARDYANNAATGYAPGIDHPPYWFEYTDEQRTKRTAAMRATLTARGIPVTPEVGK